jgi:transposase-like protein
MPTIKDALAIIERLTKSEQESLKLILTSVDSVKSLGIEELLTDERFSNGRVCPICGCIKIVRNGHRKDGTQRYVCKDCGKSFIIATNSIVSGTRKKLDTWKTYIDCMMNGLSVRKAADICEIHRNTAFIWRHKILDALQNMANSVILDGIIEADETFFPISYKGNHNKSKTFAIPRKSHKRGHMKHLRGLSMEQVCVPCAVNRNGLSIAKVANLGRVSTKDLHKTYDGKIKEKSVICTDKMNSYKRFASANDLDLIQLKTGKSKQGIYHIQHINNYHSQLKRFIYSFKGVSTKYLNNYLIWNNFVNYSKETNKEKANIFLKFVLATAKTVKNRNLSKRPPIPLGA